MISFINKFRLVNKKFLENFYLFITIKAISCFFVYIFLSQYDERIFSFTDLEFYNNDNLSIYSPNYFFSFLVKLIGYTPEKILSLKFLSLSFIISLIFTSPYIYLSTRYHNNNSTYLYILLLSLHPYLTLYSLKLDTSIFALSAISFFTLYVFEQSKNKFSFSLFFTSISTLFRNGLLPFSLSYLGLYYFVKEKKFSFINFLFIYISFLIIGFVLFSQIGYGLDYIKQNYGCYSFENIKIFLSNLVGINLAYYLAYIITPVVHLGLNFGAREAISIYCINLPENIASNNFLNITSTILFFLFNLSVFCKFIYEIFKNSSLKKFKLFLPLTILLPTLYGTAHMRYIVPLLPLWMFFLFKNRFSNNYI